jgi:hypothetical protein
MPNRWAVASGNWSNPATWNGGTLPTSADDIFSNTFSVNVDQDIDVISLRNTATTGVSVGGVFNFNTANVTANVSGQFSIGAVNLCNITATTGTVTINAPAATVTMPSQSWVVFNVTGNCNFNLTATSLSTAGVTQNGQIVNKTAGTGTLNIIANLIGGASSSGNAPFAVRVSGTATGVVNITGNLTGGTASGSSQAYFNNAGITNITGNITGGSGQTAITVSSQINLTGTITGGSGAGVVGIFNSNGNLNHIGTCQASTGASAIGGNPSGQTTILTGPFLKNGSIVAVASQSFTINSAYNPYFEFRSSNGTNVVYVNQSTLNFPAIADVRSGTTYASGLYTGALNVPLPSQVLAGIPIDATTGTLLMSPADFWNYLISNGFVSGSIGERLQNASTVATTGSQIASYTI